MEPAQERVTSDEAMPVEIIPTSGFIFQHSEGPKGLLCPPKLLPIKSFALERLEKLEKMVTEELRMKRMEQKSPPQCDTSTEAMQLPSSSPS